MYLKKFAPKMSDAVNALIEGILNQSKRLDFVIDMDTFGDTYSDPKMCYGCAATCFLQQAVDINLTSENIKEWLRRYPAYISRQKDLTATEIEKFEQAIDLLRSGDTDGLAMLYNVPFDFWGNLPSISRVNGILRKLDPVFSIFIKQLTNLRNFLIEHNL